MRTKTIWQFLKFAVVGVANTLVDWAVFYLLIFFVIPDGRFLAKALSFIVAAINSFILNSIWTFRQEFYSGIADRNLKFYRISTYFIRFFIVSLVGFIINYFTFRWVIFNISGGTLGENSNIIGLVCASGAALIWNFIINKIWTYRKGEEEKLPKEEQDRKITMFKYNLAAAGLLLFMFAISLFVMRGDSGIVDEIAHIPAGYSYLEYHDYRLNPEHPPLAKFIAAMPLAFLNLHQPNQDLSWQNIDQWENGWYFLYRSGNNPDEILFWSRLPMIILTILLGILLYKWALEVFGPKTGLFVLFLYTFTPEFLAHGHLVTTDVAAALGFVLAVYTFNKFLEKKTWKYLLLAGIVFGIAQLLKFSTFLLFAIFLVLIFIKAYFDKKSGNTSYWKALRSYFKAYILISIISVVVVWMVYIPMVWNTPVEIEKLVINNNLTLDPRILPLRNFLSAFAGNPITRALGHYLLGVMLVFGRVAGGNSTFILGHFSDKSIPWFFPVAWFLKTPATIIILTFFSIIYLLVRKTKNRAESWFLWLIAVPFVIYWAITVKGSLNIGTRHLLPTIPFLYLFIGFALKNIIESKRLVANIAVIVLVFSLAIPLIAAYPNYLGYFNVFTYGQKSYNLMVDSSLDWGQDLKRLARYAKENNIKDIKIDYFGGGLPKHYIPDSQEWRSGYGPTTGWLAVSATFYQMSKLHGKEEGKWSYNWLDQYQPVKIIGTSIIVFHITPADLQQNPPQSPYPITKYDEKPMYENTKL
ncbi:hypothetical protein COZ63_01030 [Candidatus Berkelbacteria bacterium CG_4_8_14_3_um_filter_42_13]|uniref:Glycosyltransferase RgtA/B/C/D-like domain-containing protein n=1 Tax=Candidatus Berkelbacteria bacterium CG_4_8_14_3_um_filter_42_13 TaxID=1974505 RepID=A0A2M7K1S0_9BACT|nr:MAG: hypothetical protein COZ63_01030 [Candidatus Berkelbacteria bacterium CG_4_8_14_3_um_filter_42_13]